MKLKVGEYYIDINNNNKALIISFDSKYVTFDLFYSSDFNNYFPTKTVHTLDVFKKCFKSLNYYNSPLYKVINK